MELNPIVCSLGMLSCIVFYTTSKILIYLFLIEKVQVVWSPAPRTARLTSPIYLACLSVVVMYVGVGILLVFGKISYFRGDGSCVIGLQRYASLTLLIYDLFINVLLTSLFLWPLYSARFRNAHIRRVAIRTVWAAMVALTTSCINILVLTLMHGQQLAWVCLGSCGTDVVVNALVLFWASGTDADNAPEDSNIRFKSVESRCSSAPSSGSSKVTMSSKSARDPKVCLEPSTAEDQEAQTVASSVDEDGDHDPHRSRNRAPFKGLASMFNNNDMDRHEIQITVTTQLEIIHDGVTEKVSDYKGGLDRPMSGQ
ncbi:hypothetical protein A0H81_09116 [Grifola frondosa]|uniref:Transmembrane protein n=1 Tax=Grifola frondosa TaxID=5627 RepID=A0A1C7M217_GRIFR|nr:hypothetical protein A0H81_09116 [Grifola frondosa]